MTLNGEPATVSAPLRRTAPPKTRHYEAQLRTKLEDLKAWSSGRRSNSGDCATTNPEDFRYHVRMLKDCLTTDDGALVAISQEEENMKALCSLAASEIWIKEGDLKFERGTTLDVFEFTMEEKFENAIDCLPHSLPEPYRRKLVTKARNLQTAAIIAQQLGSSSSPSRDDDEFILSWDVVAETHRTIVKDLGIPSKPRATFVMAAGNLPDYQTYASPDKIVERMDTLLLVTNENLASARAKNKTTSEQPIERRLEDSIMVATLFLCEFLKIHPFENGNGRTGRILFNWLLRDQIMVPVSLLSCERDVYLEAVGNGQWYGNPPYELCNLMARNTWLSASNALFLFGN